MVHNIFKFIGDCMILMFKLEVGFVAHVILLCLVCIVYEYIINFINKVKHSKKVFLWYVELLSKEESKSAIRKAKHQLGRLWKHVCPQVFTGTVQFGFEDPATTGDIFSKICMIYPLYAGHVVVIPNFEESVFKGNLFLKGRIRMAVLLHIGWKVGFDEEIRNFYEICLSFSAVNGMV